MRPLVYVPPILSAVTTEGATISDVIEQLDCQLRGTELEPEWLTAANSGNHANEALHGPKTCRPWPTDNPRERFAVSFCRGNSEGWIVHVDHVGSVGDPPHVRTTVQKLIVCKCLVRRQAAAVAEAIMKMLDVA